MAPVDYKKYGTLGIFLVGILLVVLVVRPFLQTILLSFVLMIIFYPVNTWMIGKLKSKTWGALATVAIITLCFIIPALLVAGAFINQATQAYAGVISIMDSDFLSPDAIDTFIKERVGASVDFQSVVQAGFNQLVSLSRDFVSQVPSKVLNFFIMLFMLYYMFKEHKKLREFVMDILPFEARQKKRVSKHVSRVLYGVVYGQLVTAFVQGVVAGIGYWIFGVNAPIFWALITFICAFVPMIGTAVVWIPAGLLLIASNTSEWWWGVGLLIYGVVIISSIDNFIRPHFISDKAGIHPVLVLLGALGGLGVFGIAGIFLGPLVIAVFIEMLIAYKEGTISTPGDS